MKLARPRAAPPNGGAALPRCVGRAAAVAAAVGVFAAGCGGDRPARPAARPVASSAGTASTAAAGGEVAGVIARSVALGAAATPPPDSAASPTRAPLRDPREVRAAALADSGFRLLVSLTRRRLYVLDGPDTVRVAPVGIGMDSTIVYQGRVWRFRTPRGVRRVLRKEADPVWVPPEWHYVEVARGRGLEVARLPARGPLTVDDSTAIEVRGGEVGLVRGDTLFTPFASEEEVIWNGVLYIPPVGTPQRQVTGELGRYRLDLGDGYLLHGTPHAESVGEASSHGCMRLGDDDIAWLYAHVPVGTPVYTY